MAGEKVINDKNFQILFSDFYQCVQQKVNAFLDVYGRFLKFQEVS